METDQLPSDNEEESLTKILDLAMADRSYLSQIFRKYDTLPSFFHVKINLFLACRFKEDDINPEDLACLIQEVRSVRSTNMAMCILISFFRNKKLANDKNSAVYRLVTCYEQKSYVDKCIDTLLSQEEDKIQSAGQDYFQQALLKEDIFVQLHSRFLWADKKTRMKIRNILKRSLSKFSLAQIMNSMDQICKDCAGEVCALSLSTLFWTGMEFSKEEYNQDTLILFNDILGNLDTFSYCRNLHFRKN